MTSPKDNEPPKLIQEKISWDPRALGASPRPPSPTVRPRVENLLLNY
jgi:hypothetical protein